MSKYAALETFLSTQDRALIRTTFAEIEKVIGQPLPASAKYPAWWSNNPSNNSMTKVWRRAGFRTEQVDVAQKTLVFRRVPPKKPELSKSAPSMPKNGFQALGRSVAENKQALAETGRVFAASGLHGALKGRLRLVGGTDLTTPADPDWGR